MNSNTEVIRCSSYTKHDDWEQSGGFAVITKISETVALKRYIGDLHPSYDSILEIALLIRARHKHIIELSAIYINDEEGEVALALPYAQNGSLTTWYESSKPSALEKKRLCYEMILGINHLHANSIVHGDIKPDNVLVVLVDGVPVSKLCDFGHSMMFADNAVPVTSNIGSFGYAPPELILNALRVHTRPSDVWQAAITIWEVFDRKQIFDAESQLEHLKLLVAWKGSPSAKHGAWMLESDLVYSPDEYKTKRLALYETSLDRHGLGPLVNAMTNYDPLARLTAGQCLKHEFFGPIVANLPSSATTTPTVLKPILLHPYTPGPHADAVKHLIESLQCITTTMDDLVTNLPNREPLLQEHINTLRNYGSLLPQTQALVMSFAVCLDLSNTKLDQPPEIVAHHLLNLSEYITNPIPQLRYHKNQEHEHYSEIAGSRQFLQIPFVWLIEQVFGQ